jgi:peptidyl-prolyl cis-trans isomerase D
VLKFIRRNAEAAWVKFMFVAIVVVFIFWGMGGIVGGEKAEVAAHINKDPIDPAEYYRAYNSLVRVYENLYKDNFKPEVIKGLDLKGRAMDQLIHGSLLRQEAKRIGLSVSESELRDAIAAMPNFQQRGHFEREFYVQILRANNLTPGDFEDAERQELLVNKLQDLIVSGVHVSDAEVHDRYVYDNEKVNLRFIKLEAPEFLSQVNVADADVQAYYDKHQESFREPDRVRLEYVRYAPEQFADKVKLSDQDIEGYYGDHKSDYEKPEQVHARHILFKVAPDATPELKAEVRKHAEEVLAKVKAGEDFAALAKQYSEDSSAGDGGDLGFFSRGKMVKPFEDAAFALAPGATSDIIESPFGFHIIKVDGKQGAHTQMLDEVRADIVAALTKDKSRDLARTQAEGDQAKAAGGETLANLAQADGLSVATPAPFARGETITGIGMVPDLTKAALAANSGDVGPVVETPTGYVVFRVSEKLPSHVPPLAEIHEHVEQAARNEQAESLAKKKADELLPELQKSDIDAVAKANKLKVEETGPFTRPGTYVPNIGNAPELKKAAFELTADKPAAPAVYTASGASVLAVFKERIPADEDQFKTQKADLLRQVLDRRRGQAMEEFTNYLKARATIDINQDFLASIPDTGRILDGGPRRRR